MAASFSDFIRLFLWIKVAGYNSKRNCKFSLQTMKQYQYKARVLKNDKEGNFDPKWWELTIFKVEM